MTKYAGNFLKKFLMKKFNFNFDQNVALSGNLHETQTKYRNISNN